ncbi:Methyltransferase 2 [Daphnia magna]|uniref:tRNA (cytosine(38)-C(5))-methyltransferase n=1 Tax=Daphnia magna TaxID=35525 RepID=A0A0N8DQU0_9CRUS|nr:Methyltransferase 2 [Daphnia magna]CAG4639376.1 EOG090X0A4V [Daphnia magna]SVE83208.1 EOG090X0A4V [Daphnia magna]
MEETKLRILELYSGIGGMHYAAELANVGAEVVFSVDINTSANEVYRHNFKQTNQQSRNIESLSANEINKLKPNVIMMSPPCQPFTRVGLKLDVEDSRCSSFLHLLDVLPHLETVSLVLMENVVGFETSEMRNAFTKALKSCGFYFQEFLLSPVSLQIPNSRNRYYLIAKKFTNFAFGTETDIMTAFPSNSCDITIPVGQKTLEPYLEKNFADEELARYLLPAKTLMKYWRILDVRQRSDISSCCFTKAYTHYAEGTGSVLQHDSNESFQEKFADFEKDGNVAHLEPLQLRYFTPREIANLMGFPAHFSFPENTSLRTRYRLLGNSLNVLVVSSLLKILLK